MCIQYSAVISILRDVIADIVDSAAAYHSWQTLAFLSLHVPEFVEPEN